MAILKFLNDNADFSANTASLESGGVFSTERCDGWRVDTGEQMAANWPEPAANDFWFHGIFAYTSNSSEWNATFATFSDADSNIILTHSTSGGLLRFTLTGDTSTFFTYPILTNTTLVTDIHIVKNGTTDLTVNIYVNGALQSTLTRPNTGDRGLPTRFVLENTDSEGDFLFGEAAVADEDTRGWRLIQLKPTAFGGDQAWSGSATSVTDGSLLTGISTDVADARVSFGLSRLESISDDALIDRVCIQTYSQRGATGPTAFNHYFRYDGGAIEDDTNNALDPTVSVFVDEYATDPNTALVWDAVTMQGLQIGVRARA